MHSDLPVGCDGSASSARSTPSSTVAIAPQREMQRAQKVGTRSAVTEPSPRSISEWLRCQAAVGAARLVPSKSSKPHCHADAGGGAEASDAGYGLTAINDG